MPYKHIADKIDWNRRKQKDPIHRKLAADRQRRWRRRHGKGKR